MYALDAELGPPDKVSDAKDVITDWVRRHALRMGAQEHEVAGAQFDLDRVFENQLLAAVMTVPDHSQWAARLQHSQNDDITRVWRTDIGLNTVSHRPMLNVRVGYTGLLDDDVSRRAPSFLRYLTEAGASLFDGDELLPEPWIIEDKREIDDVLELIVDPERSLPVIVLSAPPFTSPNLLASKALGIAHVVGVPFSLLDDFNQAITLPWAIHSGGVRTFFQNFDLAADSAILAPAARPDTIAKWQFENLHGASAFFEYLLDTCASSSVSLQREHPPLTVADIRTSNRASRAAELAEAARPNSSDGSHERATRLELALAAKTEEIEALRLSVQEAHDEQRSLTFKMAELDAFIKTLDASETEARKATHYLTIQNRALIEALRASGSPSIEAPILDDLTLIPEWVTDHYSGRLVLTTRAIRGIGESIYENASLVFRALAALGDDLQPSKAGLDDSAYQRYREALASIGVEDSKCFRDDNPGRYREQYTAVHAGLTYYLDRHLKKGVDPDPRIGFRLYYAYDEPNSRIIVGWLTSHLDTRQS